jgi:hypothetical protein
MYRQTDYSSQPRASRSAAEPAARSVSAAAIEKKANRTGLPDTLKAGVEQLSGVSLDAVRVHRNSAKPAQLRAQAYAKGNEIHLAPGQERHLPHEAWHVVQQKQGRVRATHTRGAIALNNDAALEEEADLMGAKAHQLRADPAQQTEPTNPIQRVATVAQCGNILHLAGITDLAEQRAQAAHAEAQLQYVHGKGVAPAIINPVFETFSNGALGNLPEDHEGDAIWDRLVQAHAALGGPTFDKWLRKAGLNVLDIPGLEMLLTDESAHGANEQAGALLARAQHLPAFAGRSYQYIVGVLAGLGYRRQEKFAGVSSNNDLPYGQDVWTSDDHMVVRIKVGGRSLNGRFRRPPHVVKEVTKTAHAYAPDDIIAKLTDENILIPAGTKYSAFDMQTWYNQKAGGHLAAAAWKKPEESGDPDFIEIFHRWAEGAHTAIGAVPRVPTALTGRQKHMVRLYRNALVVVDEFHDYTRELERIAQARGGHPQINQQLSALNQQQRANVDARCSLAEDVVYHANFKMFLKRRRAIATALENWRLALVNFFRGAPPVRKNKPFYRKLFSDLEVKVNEYNRSGWEKLRSSS